MTGLAVGNECGAVVPEGEGGPEHDDYGKCGKNEADGEACVMVKGENRDKTRDPPAQADEAKGPKRGEIEGSDDWDGRSCVCDVSLLGF